MGSAGSGLGRIEPQVAADDPWESKMPRDESRERDESGAGPTGPANDAAVETLIVRLPPRLQAELRPWIDVGAVGEDGFRVWLRSVLPLLPRAGMAPSARLPESPEERLLEVATALATCAGDRARAHFQAAEYFRENQLLARRVKALEAIVQTAEAARPGSPDLPSDPESARAAERYLPRASPP